MKIQIEVDIFDDEKFCNDIGGLKQCSFVHIFSETCIAFQGIKLKKGKHPKFKKCDQCKVKYQKKIADTGKPIKGKYKTGMDRHHKNENHWIK